MKRILILSLILFSLGIVLPVATAYAQEFNFEEKADQRSVEVNISKDGRMFVTHVIDSSNAPQGLELVDGTVSNLAATDMEGNERHVGIVGDGNTILILPSQTDSIVNYELEDALEFKNNYWTLDFLYLESTKFVMPESIKSFYVNDRKVELGDKKGFVCHGCQMILEYSFDEPNIIQNVKWEEQEFNVEIISHSNIDNFVFDQPAKSLTFDISEEGMFLTITIPRELLWEPYTVFLDDEQIRVVSISGNDTHVSLDMRPDNSGEIRIIGTTVVPEFPIIAPLAIGFLMILAMPFVKKRFSLH